jgi:outer membrane receptor protein involved in Fe transport
VFLATLDATYKEYAGYFDVTYFFSPRFDIEAGARAFRNEQSFTQTTGGALFFPPDFITTGPFDSSETDWTFAVAPRFHITPDTMMYGRIASGYRPGGPNPAIPPPAAGEPPTPGNSFASDSTVNYEVGFRSTFADGKASVDLTAFYIDWSDIQVSALIPRGQTGYSATVNAGSAVSKGFEWNLTWVPLTGLRLGLMGAYTDASLSDDVPEINGTKGTQLPYVPEETLTVTADYDWPVFSDYQAYIGGSGSYVGTRRTAFNFDPARSSIELQDYTTWAMQVGVRNDRYGLQLYGKNLGDERGITSYQPGTLIFGLFPFPGTSNLIRPREIGLRFTASF